MKKQLVGLIVVLLFVTITVPAAVMAQSLPGKGPEGAIEQYLAEKHISLAPDSPERGVFMKDILWGQYPELSQGPDGEAIRRYAADYINRESADLRTIDLHLEPGPQPEDQGDAQPNVQTDVSVTPAYSGYNRSAAVNYAYNWAVNGGQKRNSSFPNFTDNDCTNFVSQAVWAGGVPRSGSGDGCRDEGTTREWYSFSASPPLWCIGSNRNFVWSSAWSVVSDFWNYQTQYARNATSTTYSATQLTSLRNAAALGDIVQLQDSTGGAKWHSMVVTKKANGEIYLTYHSGPGGNDVVDKSLKDVSLTGAYSYWLIHF